jgi:hypothetical protein
MDQNTILFVQKNGGGIAFDYNYYRNNYDKYSNLVADPQMILFKMGTTAFDWIDYRRAIQTKSGGWTDRLQAAYNDSAYKITDLRQIPETTYYDAQGFQFFIPPYDGEYNTAFWLARTNFNYDAIQFAFNNDDLLVTFDEKDNINNAVLSLNSMFYNWEMVDYHTALFRNVKPLLTKIQTVGSDDYNNYATRIQAYSWEGLNKKPAVFPTGRQGTWFILDAPIEENSFIIYHGIMYEYELDYNDKRKFQLLNVTAEALAMFSLDEVFVYQMVHQDANKEARKYITRGIGNRYLNSVDFTLPINNSMVLFNGVDSEYTVQEVAAIEYPESLFSPTHVSNLSFITQINFMLGM